MAEPGVSEGLRKPSPWQKLSIVQRTNSPDIAALIRVPLADCSDSARLVVLVRKILTATYRI
jgi:hypothetical protein